MSFGYLQMLGRNSHSVMWLGLGNSVSKTTDKKISCNMVDNVKTRGVMNGKTGKAAAFPKF